MTTNPQPRTVDGRFSHDLSPATITLTADPSLTQGLTLALTAEGVPADHPDVADGIAEFVATLGDVDVDAKIHVDKFAVFHGHPHTSWPHVEIVDDHLEIFTVERGQEHVHEVRVR